MLVEIRKGMYGVKQDEYITSDRLKKYLAKYGYVPCAFTPSILTQVTQKIKLCLCVNYISVKYEKIDIFRLFFCLKNMYTVSKDWESKLYLKMTIN